MRLIELRSVVNTHRTTVTHGLKEKGELKTFFMSDDRIRDMELDPETPAVDKKEVKIYFLKMFNEWPFVAMKDIIYAHLALSLFLL